MYEDNPGNAAFKKPLFKRMRIPHYYGDRVRACLILISFILLATMLVDWKLAAWYMIFGVIGVLTLVVLAGMTSPRSRLVLITEALICGLGFVVFEYAAIIAFASSQDFSDQVFLMRQLLAFLFLVALYYSIKSVRGVIVSDTNI